MKTTITITQRNEIKQLVSENVISLHADATRFYDALAYQIFNNSSNISDRKAHYKLGMGIINFIIDNNIIINDNDLMRIQKADNIGYLMEVIAKKVLCKNGVYSENNAHYDLINRKGKTIEIKGFAGFGKTAPFSEEELKANAIVLVDYNRVENAIYFNVLDSKKLNSNTRYTLNMLLDNQAILERKLTIQF